MPPPRQRPLLPARLPAARFPPPCLALPPGPAAAASRVQPGNSAAFNQTQASIKRWIREWVITDRPHWPPRYQL